MQEPLRNETAGNLGNIKPPHELSICLPEKTEPDLRLPKNFEVYLRKEIVEVARTTEIPPWKEIYLFPNASLTAMLGILKYIKSEERMRIAATVISSLSGDNEINKQIRFKLPQIFGTLKREEKLLLAEILSKEKPSGAVDKMVLMILKSAQSLSELDYLAKAIKGLPLNRSHNTELTELFALGIIGKKLTSLPLPKKASKYSGTPILNRRMADMEQVMLLGKEILFRYKKEFGHTRTFDEYRRIINNCLKYFKDVLTTIEKTHTPLEKRVPKKSHQIRDLYNALCGMLQISLEHCVMMSAEVDKKTKRMQALWPEKYVDLFHDAIKVFPEGKIRYCPKIFEIRRMVVTEEDETTEKKSKGARKGKTADSKEEGREDNIEGHQDVNKAINVKKGSIMAAREFGTGLITLDNNAFCEETMEDFYPGVPSGTSIAIHELMHAFHLGSSSEQELIYDKTGKIIGPSDPDFPYDEFLNLEGWRVVYPLFGTLESNDKILKIDDKEYRLYVKERFEGKDVVLLHSSFHQGIVFLRKADSNFSYGDECYNDPGEDIAESGTDYFLDPKSLIFYCPEKFLLWEEIFKVYEDNRDVMTALSYRLNNPKKKEAEFVSDLKKGEHRKVSLREEFPLTRSQSEFLSMRFSVLTAYEQALVLAKLQKCEGSINKHSVSSAVSQYVERNPTHRQKLFDALSTRRVDISKEAVYAVLEEYKKYSPVLLTALNAVYNREHIALLTSRGNWEGHAPLREAIYHFLGYRIPAMHEHFLADGRYESLWNVSSRLSRKSEVILGLLRGEIFNLDGKVEPLGRHCRIVYYDNDPERIRQLKLIRRHFGLYGQLQLVSSTKISAEKEWINLLSKVRNTGDLPPQPRKKVIRIFDLDGCLINLPSKIHIKNQQGDKIRSLTHEEFDSSPAESHWLDQQGNTTLDFSEFWDSEIIARQVVQGSVDNQLFKC